MFLSRHNTTKYLAGAARAKLRLQGGLPITAIIAVAINIAAASADDRGWDYEPYRIHALLAVEAPGGLSQRITDELPGYLERRVQSAIGPLWQFDVELATGPARHRILSRVSKTDIEPPPGAPADCDKLLLLAVRRTFGGFELTAREFDCYVQRWGTPIQTICRQGQAVPEQLFAVVAQAVAPLAHLELDPDDEHRVQLLPRGAALARKDSTSPLLRPGDVFLPIRRHTTRGGELAKDGIQVVPWTFVEVDKTDDNTYIARIHSANRRPLGARRQGRVEQVAIGVRAQAGTTTLRLHSRTAPDKPLVGYQVFAQPADDDTLLPLGSTDRDGKLAISPGERRVRTLYLKNGGLLLARLPIVPGAEPQIDVPLPDDDPRLAAESRLAALREELIDVVARRNILIARTRQKIKQKDFDDAKELLTEVDQLPGRSQFNLTLTTAARTLRSKDPQIQRRIDQLIEATQTVMNQYLDLRTINQLHEEFRAAQK